MIAKTLELTVDGAATSWAATFSADALICCGWVGRDRAALQAHIDELAHLGVPPPTRAPIYMTFSPYLLTTDEEMQVVSGTTSGEVEYVLLRAGGTMWVTVGSDQTDRNVETKSIVASKQMCGKFLARRCWPFEEVADHWDELVLRCWITKDGRRALYQDSPLASILAPDELLQNLPAPHPQQSDGLVLFSGTIATKAGLVYADAYELELEDPVRRRTIRAGYCVKILPQHI
jgi:Protein of unknown function (DUF2848)